MTAALLALALHAEFDWACCLVKHEDGTEDHVTEPRFWLTAAERILAALREPRDLDDFNPDNPPDPQPGRDALATVLHAQAIGCWYDSHHVRYCEPDAEHHAKHADRLLSARAIASRSRIATHADSAGSGGLSALEDAFDLLGWADPQPAPEARCDEPGCMRRGTCGFPTPSGYRRTCFEHSSTFAGGVPLRMGGPNRIEELTGYVWLAQCEDCGFTTEDPDAYHCDDPDLLPDECRCPATDAEHQWARAT